MKLLYLFRDVAITEQKNCRMRNNRQVEFETKRI